ncbi:hypothetical protein D3C84_1081700 [compost metagenome]
MLVLRNPVILVVVEPVLFDRLQFGCENPRAYVAVGAVARNDTPQIDASVAVERLACRFLVVAAVVIRISACP